VPKKPTHYRVSPTDALDLRIRELADLPGGWYTNPQGERLGKAPSWKALMALRRFALAWMPDDVREDLQPDAEGGASLFYDGDRDVVRVRFSDDGTVTAELRGESQPLDVTDITHATQAVRYLLQRKP
jgi:hypothetical protein